MKICIHRGTHEIGGTCVEIESQGQRIVLDVGMPLDAANPDDVPLHPIKGLDSPDSSLLGVCISHPHQDHYGLAHRLPNETTFLLGKATESILAAAELFTPAGLTVENVVHFEDRKVIRLGPFAITPFLVDHSAYDSYALLVEADGERLFYSGDFRAHGRKSSLFQKLVADPPGNVDVLLMEGTTVGRPESAEGFPSESDLEGRFVELFNETSGMPLVWCSGQNIDRIVTIFRACRRAGRRLIVDMYTAHILRATGNDKVPQAEWDGISVFLPKSQKWRIIQNQAFDVSNRYRAHRIFAEQLADAAANSVMLFRPSMSRDLEDAACLSGAWVICSVWKGYLDESYNGPFLDWLARHELPLHHCHTSGHAAIAELRTLRGAFREANVVPIHLDDRARFLELFGDVDVHEDGEWWAA